MNRQEVCCRLNKHVNKYKMIVEKGNISFDSAIIMRGIAIICIILYNFIRHLIFVDGNEMQWRDINVELLINGLHTKYFLLHIISFWGWYGVPIFIFLSGYGLTKKYQNIRNCGSFLWYHTKKLLLLMIPAYSIYLFLYVCVYGKTYPTLLILKQCTFTANILSDYIEPGVYWFFGLMMQFYILFLFIRKVKFLCVLLAASLIVEYCILYFSLTPVFFKHNCIGWMSSFFLGMILAKRHLVPTKLFSYLSIPLFIVSSIVKSLSPLSPLLFIIAILGVRDFNAPKSFYNIGAASSTIFVIHPIIRLILYNSFTNLHLLIRILFYCLLILLVTFIISANQRKKVN